MLTSLANELLHNPEFVAQFQRLIVDSVQSDLQIIEESPGGQEISHDWGYLLLAASLFSKVSNTQETATACHDAALRIAQFCLTRQFSRVDSPTAAQQASAANILGALANLPAISLAIRRNLLPDNPQSKMPLPARLDWVKRSIENSVVLVDNQVLSVNHFQRRLWEELQVSDWLSFSAPTSAGKSFIVTRWVLDFIQSRRNPVVVYLVPTRALIAQVESEFGSLIRESNLEGVTVSSLPLARNCSPDKATVFVLTQERFQLLLGNLGLSSVDALIVDEAHKVGDGHRGVLLQHVIEEVGRLAPNAKVVFASPMTENPWVLVADAPEGRRQRAFSSNDVTVAQNLLWVSQRSRYPRSWDIQLCLPSHVIDIGRVQLPATPDRESKRLSYIAFTLGEGSGGNIVYVNSASDAEKVALQIYGLREGCDDNSLDSRLIALIDLTRRTVHPDFSLVTVLQRRVAFHYGNLPLLIRTEIERLFSDGILKYLVCTSTLIEGVNMSCRNIFVRGPTKGRRRPMAADDFWNLAGRAGRWGKEFQGNIFCVDARRTEIWAGGSPPRNRHRYAITRTADSVVSQADDLIEFVMEGTPRLKAVQRPDLEFVFSYLVTQLLRHGTIRELPWVGRLNASTVNLVEATLRKSISELRTPLSIIERNPGISPLAMDALLNRFGRPNRDPVTLLPADPSSDDAVDVYTSVFGRIAGELNAALGPPGSRSYALSLLVTRWMRGFPVARLISDRIRYERERGKENVPGVIRAVLNDVEQIARFEAPRSLACYIDLLKFHLNTIGLSELTTEFPDFNLMLELGVSRPSQISLIGLGLSRTSTVMLSEIITDDNLDEHGALGWLREGAWQTLSLPELVRLEVENVLNTHQSSSAVRKSDDVS